jgi:subtilisin family serine protease/subtilisin-like proprotein convertase family protein
MLSGTGYDSDSILVRLEAGTAESTIAQAISGSALRSISRFGLYEMSLPAGVDPLVAISNVSSLSGVRYAEPNWVIAKEATPNDAMFSSQWSHRNLGQPILGVPGVFDADTDATNAWDSTTGSSLVTIAIVDTGVDYTHPDLAANIWTNAGEIAGNNLDDDGNGFVDDIRGWDFGLNDNDPIDEDGHGTHVAGIAGAVGNNGIGVAGVNWNVRIMPVKIFGDASQTLTAFVSAAIEGLQYAVDNGAFVSNHSYNTGTGGPIQAYSDMIDYAEANGHVFVSSAGNTAQDNDVIDHYPSDYPQPNVVAVAATTNQDQLAVFSNYGATTVHLGAPGESILSTLPGGQYGYLDGTSMASPHVAGAVALLKSTNPSLTYDRILGAIYTGVDPLPGLATTTITGGRLNLNKALSQLSVATFTITPTTIREDAGNNAATITITRRNFPLDQALDLDLFFDDTTEVAVPALSGGSTVTIPAFQNTLVIPINAVDDTLLDGTQTVTFDLQHLGASIGMATLQVTDAESLTVQVNPAAVLENAGPGSATVTVTRSNTDTLPPDSYVVQGNRLDRYTFGGSLVNSRVIPWPTGARPAAERARDAAVLPNGRVAIYNGTNTVYLSIFNPTTLGWQHILLPGVSSLGTDNAFGGITSVGNYVFLTDMQSSPTDPYGAVRVDTTTGAVDRFATRSLIDRLFVKDVFQDVILEVDPITGATVNTIPMPISGATNFGFNNGLAYDGQALWLLAGPIGNDQIYKLDPDTGTVLEIHDLGGTSDWDGLASLNGLLYALDNLNENRIHVYDPVLRQVVRILNVGVQNAIAISGGLAALTGPDRLIVTGQGFVADQIHEIDPASGLLIRSWNSGMTTQELGVATVNNEIYIGEFIGGELKVFSRDGVFQRSVDVSLALPEGVLALGGDNVKGMGPTPYRYRDIYVGLDDKVYVLDQAGLAVGRFNLTTLDLEEFFEVSQPVNAISVSADGTIWGAGVDGKLYHFSATGAEIASLVTGVPELVDISQNVTGQILLTSRNGQQLRTNTSMAAPTQFNVSAGTAFEAFGRHQSLPSGDLIVTLTNSDISELSVPVQVVIPIGQQSVTIPIDVLDDNILDGPQTVTVTGTAQGYAPSSDTIDVLDAEEIVVDIAALQIAESDGQDATTVTVRRTDVDGPFAFVSQQSFSNSTQQTILDFDITRSFITIPDQNSRLTDVNVTLSLRHTWIPDLDIFLVSPSGARVELVTDLTSNQAFMTGTQFDDQAGAGILTGAGPFTGSFRPEGLLSDLNGLNPSGIWTLEITDDNPTDFGTLFSWSLEITTAGLAPMTVQLALGGDPDEIALNSLTVVIPANQSEVTVPVHAIDDNLLDGTRTSSISAVSVDAVGYLLGTDNVDVTDDETLTFTISSNAVSEAAGPAALTGTLTRFNSDLSLPFTVNLSSSDTSELTVPATVTIPANEASVTFSIDAVDDTLVDGTQQVTITVNAPEYGADKTQVIDVLDLEPSLQLTTSTPVVREDGGNLEITITRVDQSDITMPMIVDLASSNVPVGGGLVLNVPGTVTIPANEVSVTLAVTIVDNDLLEGTRIGRIDASSAGIIPGAIEIQVTDVERLTVTIDRTEFLENGGPAAARGTVTRSNTNISQPLTVNLLSSDTSELTVPATVVIPANATSVSFDIAAVNDPDLDGPQVVTITASSAGYFDGMQDVTVLDHEPPVITAPVSVTSNPLPTVIWGAIAGAVRYELLLSNLSSGVNQLVYNTTLTTTQFTPPEALGIGLYRVWVRAIDALERPGFWSLPKDFRIDTAPTITAPVTTGTIATPTFPEISWTAVKDAARYELWVNNLTTGAVRVIWNTNLVTTTYVSTEGLGSGRYTAWVRAYNAYNEFGRWSAPKTFTVLAAPGIITPGGGTFDRTPTYSWNAIAGATAYDVWVSSRTTNSIVYRNQFVAGTSIDQPVDLPTGDYTVWVRAKSGSQVSPWSAGKLFSVARPPVITSPAANSVTSNLPTFVWTGLSGTERYELWVTHLNSNTRVIYLTNLTGTSFTAVNPLAAGNYRVWVRAVSAMGETTAWSTDVRFSVASVDSPTPEQPAGVNPLLTSAFAPVTTSLKSVATPAAQAAVVRTEATVVAVGSENSATAVIEADVQNEQAVVEAWNTSDWWLTANTEPATPSAPARKSRRESRRG